MKEPWPVNLMTDEEVRVQGWAALSRDADGHLITTHAPFISRDQLAEYLADEYEAGRTVKLLQPIDYERGRAFEEQRIASLRRAEQARERGR